MKKLKWSTDGLQWWTMPHHRYSIKGYLIEKYKDGNYYLRVKGFTNTIKFSKLYSAKKVAQLIANG